MRFRLPEKLDAKGRRRCASPSPLTRRRRSSDLPAGRQWFQRGRPIAAGRVTIVTGLGPAEKGNSGVEAGAWTTPPKQRSGSAALRRLC